MSKAVAREHLAVQRQGGDAVEDIKKLLGKDYAGIWFDNSEGRFKVGVVPGSDRSAIAEWTRTRKMQGLTDAVPVRSTWTELTEAQDAFEATVFDGTGENPKVQVALDPASNAIEVRGLRSDSQHLAGRLNESRDRLEVNIEFEVIGPEEMDIEPNACVFPDCDYPLGAGQAAWKPILGGSDYLRWCTLAFWARGGVVVIGGVGTLVDNPYVLTAGHCFSAGEQVHASNTAHVVLPTLVGPTDVSYTNAFGDFAAIRSSTLQWTPLWPSIWYNRAAFWGIDTNRAINDSKSSYPGMWLCHSGVGEYETNGYRLTPLDKCGVVEALNQTVDYPNYPPMGGLTRSSGCGAPGDSGGPYVWYNSAVGIHSGSSETCGPNSTTLYSEVNLIALVLRMQVGGQLW